MAPYDELKQAAARVRQMEDEWMRTTDAIYKDYVRPYRGTSKDIPHEVPVAILVRLEGVDGKMSAQYRELAPQIASARARNIALMNLTPAQIVSDNMAFFKADVKAKAATRSSRKI